MTVFEAIDNRSSARSYTSEALTAEEVRCIVEAGLKAPTSGNRQELFFSVLKGDHPLLREIEAEKNRLSGSTPAQNFYYDAPLVIIVSGIKDDAWCGLDAGIAVENMALAAEGLGLGNVILGCIKNALLGEKEAYFADALGLPAGYEYKVAIAVGRYDERKLPHTYDAQKLVKYL